MFLVNKLHGFWVNIKFISNSIAFCTDNTLNDLDQDDDENYPIYINMLNKGI